METVIPVAEICSELGGLVRTTMRVRVWELARCDWNRDAFDFGLESSWLQWLAGYQAGTTKSAAPSTQNSVHAQLRSRRAREVRED